jgi:predicted  nucleic acid-binding Zn-ribbon protein
MMNAYQPPTARYPMNGLNSSFQYVIDAATAAGKHQIARTQAEAAAKAAAQAEAAAKAAAQAEAAAKAAAETEQAQTDGKSNTTLYVVGGIAALLLLYYVMK